MNAYEEDTNYAERPNKTQIKKDIAALLDLAEEMLKLSRSQLLSLELPEDIYQALLDTVDMPPKGARKRQLKYITGKLRNIDMEPYKEKLSRIKNKSAHANREHHLIENWRDKLLEQGNDALTQFLSEFPAADRQHLRQLLRQAKKEHESARPPKSARLIYQYLKNLLINHS